MHSGREQQGAKSRKPFHPSMELDVNPIHKDLLGYTETLLRAALNRCNVSTESLVRLIQVTSLLYRRAAAAKPVGSDALPSNPIVHAMLEVIAESVRLKARTTPATLTSLFEVHGFRSFGRQ